MALEKMTTCMEEDLPRSAKILAARRDSKIEEAPRRYLREAEADESRPSLADSLSGSRTRQSPGISQDKADGLSDGDTFSGAVFPECERPGY